MGLIALVPGSFDPVTNGHVDVIEQATRCFDAVVVAVLDNPAKEPLFTVEERSAMLKEAVSHLEKVEVDSFSGLVVEYARARGVAAIVKGLRGPGDLDFELRMAQMNRHLTGVPTLLVPTNPQWSHVSSSLIKEVSRLGGDVSGLVPDVVRDRLEEKRPRESE